MDDILNIAQPAMRVTEPLPGKIPLLFQLLDRAADRIHPIFTNMGQALSRIANFPKVIALDKRSEMATHSRRSEKCRREVF